MRRVNFAILLVAFVVAAFGFTGVAECDDRIVEVENFGEALVFLPTVEFKEMILTVTGPCDYQYRQVVKEKGELVFKLNRETIDGAYTYGVTRMEEVPREIIEILQQARKKQDDSVARALCRDGKLPGPPLNQSGGFLVVKGQIIYDERANEKVATKQLDAGGLNGQMSIDTLSEAIGRDATVAAKASSPDKDFVINDDLIVDGSACIGFDCVNGEVFGFDTIRLKENNLRIKFDDTSVVPSFPANDWQLTANDSANGGASKFSIDDISGNRTPFTVEANSRSHALYVDDGGRIGSRTSTPSVEIHTIDGDTPTLRLQQDGSSGFAPQTWDVAGNETNFFIRDVTNGSQLPFRIRPDAPTSSIFIDVDGSIGLGTSSPDAKLHLVDDAAVQFDYENTATGETWRMVNSGPTDSSTFIITNLSAPGAQFTVEEDGDVLVQGNLVTGGGGTCDPGPCDGVFQPGYEVESIEEHATFMWENSYLWGVGPTPEGEPINISKKTTGILHELEKAHIYIEQLHEQIKELETTRSDTVQMQSTIEDLQKRLEALEGMTRNQ